MHAVPEVKKIRPICNTHVHKKDEATVEIAEMVLCGSVNKRTVHEIAMAGGSALGLSGKDAALLRAKQLDPKLGLVGEVAEVNVDLLEDLLDVGLIPVIAPIGIGLNEGDEGTTSEVLSVEPVDLTRAHGYLRECDGLLQHRILCLAHVLRERQCWHFGQRWL